MSQPPLTTLCTHGDSPMKIIKPDNHEHWLQLRLQDVTSTEVSALFGLNPYMTEFELWHRKKNQEVVAFEENERMKWGNRLEQAIAEGISEDNQWMVHPFKDYARDENLRAGSSFDYMVAVPNEAGDMPIEGLLEIKNVDSLQFRDKWIVDNGKVVEAPPHIELQVQQQLMITGYPFLYIGALVGGNTVTLIKRTPDEAIISAIKAKILKFWNSIDNNIEPQPDFIRDAEFISKVYNYAEPGKLAEPTELLESLALQYKDYAAKERDAKKIKDSKKAEMLKIIGDAEKVKGDTFSISAGVVGPAEVSYTRDAYRTFRVYFKKGKADGTGKTAKH